MTRLTGLILFLILALPAAAQPPQWQMLPDESFIGWTAVWQSTAVQGGFRDFTADIRFDPDDLAASKVAVTVAITSVYLKGQDAETTLENDNWFYEDKFPKAVFETKTIRHLGDDRYEAVADLRIRSVTQEVVLPFTLSIEGDRAHVEGGLTLNRKTFNIGGGDFAQDVAAQEDVQVAVTAERR